MDKVVCAPLALTDRAVGVFIKAGPVIFCKGISVNGKMHGHEIHNNADAAVMALVDKLHKLCGSAVS